VPLMVIDVLAGRSAEQLTELLDAAHEAMVEAFAVPVVRMTSRPRTREQKERFYSTLCEHLQRRCGVEPSDLVVSITENPDEDWCFGLGRAQFLTGEL
jgi:phenylpyruvate tautomerase PptA (4-oxalocrotonate tautomerase family)